MVAINNFMKFKFQILFVKIVLNQFFHHLFVHNEIYQRNKFQFHQTLANLIGNIAGFIANNLRNFKQSRFQCCRTGSYDGRVGNRQQIVGFVGNEFHIVFGDKLLVKFKILAWSTGNHKLKIRLLDADRQAFVRFALITK